MELLFVLIGGLAMVTCVSAHGRLIFPPSRSAMWRYGYNVPKNSDDMSLNCGGQGVIWSEGASNKRGLCGVCGDSYNAPVRENEAGGKYASGIIGHTYKEGEVIEAVIDVMVAHGGWSEFRICPNNNVHRPVTQECLDQHLLYTVGGKTRFYHPTHTGNITVNLVLPVGLTCTQCVLQWWWKANSNNNCNPDTGEDCCIACGRQELFVNCADIAIAPGNHVPVYITPRPTPRPIQQVTNRPAVFPPVPTKPMVIPPKSSLPKGFVPIMTDSTKVMPGHTGKAVTSGYMPIDIGSQKCQATAVGVQLYGSVIANRWCQAQCKVGSCPASLCATSCRE